MEILLNSVYVVLGLGLLYAGGNYLVHCATALSVKFNISPIVIGLTVVAFGTSAPELFVSLISALRGYSDISLGNVVGSNIINIALILGLSACIMPLSVKKSIVSRDIPIMFAGYTLLVLATLPMVWEAQGGGRIFRIEALVLICALVLYLFLLYKKSMLGEGRVSVNASDLSAVDSANSFSADVSAVEAATAEVNDSSEGEEIPAQAATSPESEAIPAEIAEAKDWANKPIISLILFIIGGTVALGFGSDFFVRGASWIARNIFQASDRFIGVSIVALGTSLPELFASIVAVFRKQMDISIGNVVGSNIFNSLMVLGVTGLLRPLDISAQDFSFDIVIMLGISLFLYLILAWRKKLERPSAFLLILSYCAYFAFLLQTRGV